MPVVNLRGILFERGRQRFDVVQAFGAEACALSAAAHGARLVHVSAIGAERAVALAHARSKAMGEKLVRAAVPGATILGHRSCSAGGFVLQPVRRDRAPGAGLPLSAAATPVQPVFAGDVAPRFGGGRFWVPVGSTYELADGVRSSRAHAGICYHIEALRLNCRPFGLPSCRASLPCFSTPASIAPLSATPLGSSCVRGTR